MSETKFSDLDIMPEIKRAIDTMGFEKATSIQAQAIPIIKSGADFIGRSQTGTGKTIAFGIPALEVIDVKEEKNSLQVMIICPTRELAQQACEEVRKLSKFTHGIKAVEVYGGVPMDRQIVRLKKANVVIGTPGRIMDHMRRKTLKVNNLKMIVLDEADEMLSMGFKEDIETILTDTPEDRQTILFSATMPPSILAITKQFQKSPKIVEIDKKNVTLDNIQQFYIDAPMGRKMDALKLLLHYHQPHLAIIFCNTKRMVDEIAQNLCNNGFQAEGLHGDMKQSQRTKVMDSFKYGRTKILVATDVAARGIDVNDIDYVINYDIPQNIEYYVHRIGRTGRAGKEGKAMTLCSGRRQVYTMRDIGRMVKSEVKPLKIPTLKDIQIKSTESNTEIVEKALENEPTDIYVNMVNALVEKGLDINKIAAMALELNFGKQDEKMVDIKVKNKSFTRDANGKYKKMIISIGRSSRVAPNHIVGAITELTNLNGSDIGKIEIYDDKSIVAVPSDRLNEVVEAMVGCKICGKPTTTIAMMEKNNNYSSFGGGSHRGKPSYGKNQRSKRGGYDRRRKKEYK